METDDKALNPSVWAFKIIGFFMSIALMVSSFFLKSAWDKIYNLEKQMHAMEIKITERTANRFDSEDWIREKVLMDSKLSGLDRRLIRMEETLPVIKESLQDIKNALKAK